MPCSFFFSSRRRHTSSTRDWSSDVCSSDLRAVVLAIRVPVFQLDHDLDALLLTHGADAEQPLDIDEAHAADLHEMMRQLVAAAHEDVVAVPGDVHHVGGDEAVAALDEVEDALA